MTARIVLVRHGEAASDSWAGWCSSLSFDVMPDGEGSAAFLARVWSAVSDLAHAHGEATLALVTHTTVLQGLVAHVVGRPLAGRWPFRFDHASVTVLEMTAGGPLVTALNDTGH